MTAWLVVLALLWLLLTLHDVRGLRSLPALPPATCDGALAAVTVVLAVRDDVAHVRACVASLLAQRGVDVRVVVADDRSSDGTGAALDALAAAEPRLRVVHVTALPDGWLGKTHALHVAAADVATPWLLFTDGDALLAPDALARALDAAARTGADHVSLLPGNRRTTLAGRACLVAFVLAALRRIAAVNATPQRSFAGTGAFNLVRTDAWRAIGGHAPLRLEVVDDVWLGGLLLRAGFRTRIWHAPDALTVEWGGTPRELLRVTTKNLFAALRYRTAAALAATAVVGGLLAATLAAPLLAGRAGWLPFAAFATGGLPGVVLARRMGWEPLAGVLAPFARTVLPVVMLHSVATTLRHGGVRWRGTFYPLAQLRAGQAAAR